ncbi:MAG: LD-carboxypeptidase [Hyphomonadaceae bacterium]
MSKNHTRIGIVAPGARMDEAIIEGASAIASQFGASASLHFHPQCFERAGHFAGTDEVRAQAFLDIANDPSFDALWIGRGGYGAARILPFVLPHLTEAARAKTYLGYSDAGSLLGALYGAGFPHIAHGPMPADIKREGGGAAVKRGLSWLIDRAADAVEPGLKRGEKYAAFNIVILSHLIGTPWQPDLKDHIVLIEDIAEYTYRTDRDLCHITSNEKFRRAAGIRLGRVSEVPDNIIDFGQTEEEVARHWCARAGIEYLGRADIGHDAENRVVPFGVFV